MPRQRAAAALRHIAPPSPAQPSAATVAEATTWRPPTPLPAPCSQIMYNSRKMHKPKDKWRSREYGFVDFATVEDAAKAVASMTGVNVSLPR